MPYQWPPDTDFTLWELDVEDRDCRVCGRRMYICDHRYRHLHTLEGPVELVCKLNHCPDRNCPGHTRTISPELEPTIAPPSWAIGWDVFCWIGHRRFSRHWSIPQIRLELGDDYGIKLSDAALLKYVGRYQIMLAARQQDPESIRQHYASTDQLVFSIDGLQPEKGHETLYVVRELTGKRVWFAEALLSATTEEIQKLIAKAKEWAAALGKPVAMWISDKQKAFVTAIAAEFPGVTHRYCDNHFLRDVAKPVLEADSHAKVQMRRKVRGLRSVEQAVLEKQRSLPDENAAAPETDPPIDVRSAGATVEPADDAADGIVLEYCAAVRGILNNDQGGPLNPPGLQMAEALTEVRDSLQKNLDAKKGGFAHEQLVRLADCIDRGLDHVHDEQMTIREYVAEIAEVAATIDPQQGNGPERQAKYAELTTRFQQQTDDPIHVHMAGVMMSFVAGLFVGEATFDEIRDNLDLERWFRLPKSHERRIHGHRHAGVRIVQEGPTLVHTLDAHLTHPEPFSVDELLAYRTAQEPACQKEAKHRRKIMRKARSKKKRPILLAELERRYRELPGI
jgi:hypothetical protein